jgi:predicted glycosyltransferase
MNILIQLSHPAHFHLYKNVAKNLMSEGHKVFILIKTKDILEDLLQQSGLPYYNILKEAHRKSKLGILWDMFVRDWRMLRFVRKNKIDLLTGSTVEVAQVGWLTKKYRVNTGEDDMNVVPLFPKMAGPFMGTILSPRVCNNYSLEPYSVKYESYHELAYLHPNQFVANKEVVEKYFSAETPYFILRFSSLNAYHDNGIKGINTEIAQRLIDILKPHGRIYITSERELESQFEPYRIKINTLDMHHVMAFATLYIGDSQTMAAEAGVLGVPFVRYNDFVGRIGYLNELENDYHLGYGIKASETGSADRMYKVVEDILAMPNLKEEWQTRRQKMLSEKIDYAQFLTWFIENYPESREIMKKDPNYQFRFK